MNKALIEACVGSYECCKAAWENGADRLELCANLIIGGTTPSVSLFKQVQRDSDVKINVLIRPRFGDFLYTESEIESMCEEISTFRDLGANGVVIGALTAEGDLDKAVMRRMIDCAGDMKITLHRAFDMSRDAFEAMETAIELGVSTILTSGQQGDVVAGKDMLKALFERAAGRIDIMAGCGVKKYNIMELHEHTGIKVFHTTGRKENLDSGMKYRNANVYMGIPGMSEYEIWRTDGAEFKECADIVHSFA